MLLYAAKDHIVPKASVDLRQANVFPLDNGNEAFFF
jgi:hypothetical protein